MAANHTPFYQLNQWQPEDPVLREDFNADNAKLDQALDSLNRQLHCAGNAQVEYSTYTGNGGSTLSLTFHQRPLMVLVMGGESLLIPGQPSSGAIFHTANTAPVQFSWSGNTVSWNTTNADACANVRGRTYHYFALYHTA